MSRLRLASPWAFALVFLMLAVLGYGIARAAADPLDDMLAMTAQLDEMDRRDMQDLIEQVLKCSGAHDFDCADAKFIKAAKLAHSKDDKLVLADVRGAIDADKDVVRLEQQAEQAEREAREEEERAEAWANACEAQCQDPDEYNRCVTHYLRPSMCGQQHADSSGIDQTGLAIIGTINKTFSDAARFNSRQQAQIDSTFGQIAADRAQMQREQAQRMQAQDDRNRAIRGEQSAAAARAAALRAQAQQRAQAAMARAQAERSVEIAQANASAATGGLKPDMTRGSGAILTSAETPRSAPQAASTGAAEIVEANPYDASAAGFNDFSFPRYGDVLPEGIGEGQTRAQACQQATERRADRMEQARSTGGNPEAVGGCYCRTHPGGRSIPWACYSYVRHHRVDRETIAR